jgi:WW domain-containing oxidoreductase
MSLYSKLQPNGPSGFGYGSTAEDVTRGLSLSGKTFLVTGCNSGLGLETARVLASRGGRVVGTARSAEKAKAALSSLGGSTVGLECELSEPASVRAAVQAVKASLSGARIDALIGNAGIMALPAREQKFGIELQFFTNHIGHFMLVNGLLDRLAPQGRVVIVASNAHRRAPAAGIEFDNLSGARGYVPWQAYGQSKLANILFTKELARRLSNGRTANTLHPGVIATNLSRSMPALSRLVLRAAAPLVLKDEAQGAATQVFAATHPSVAGVTGQYFSHCQRAEPEPIANDPALAARLWQESERIVAGVG